MRKLITILLTAFIANMVFFADAFAADSSTEMVCPAAGSAAEEDMIFQEGPTFMETGKASTCMMALIQAEKAQFDRMDVSVTEAQIVETMMVSIIKAKTQDY